MISFPNAKINIGLNVVSKRSDGYHNLETIFYPIKLSDALEITDGSKLQLTCSGLKIETPNDNNLVLKAYKILQKEFKLPPVKLHLHKKIPFGAGLGGGSSDAVHALKMLNTYFKLNISVKNLEKYAELIGADCPFFIRNKPAFATGIGNNLHPIHLNLSKYQILIIKPHEFVSTQDAYRDIVPSPSVFNLNEITNLPIEKWKDYIGNDFEKTVFRKYPQIEKIKNSLYLT